MKQFNITAIGPPYNFDEDLHGAVHIETHMMQEGHGYTMLLFAFYPDDHDFIYRKADDEFRKWLVGHENDIADCLNDFGDLQAVFKEMLKRDAHSDRRFSKMVKSSQTGCGGVGG